MRLSRFAPWIDRLFSGPGLPIVFAGVYLVAFLIPYPLLKWYAVAQASFASIANHTWWSALGLALAGLILIGLNGQMWRVARRRPGARTHRLILVGWLAASVCLLLTFPGQSTDLGDYIFRAHMLVDLGKNPLTTPPSAVIAFKDFPYLAWYKEVDAYGPLWQWLAGAAHAVVGADLLANMLAFKIIALLMTAASGALIFSLLRQLAPAYAEAGLAVWLWNPLVLNEGALHGHNDLVMVTLALAGVWLLLRHRPGAGLVVLVLAGLIKVYAWIMLPVAVVWLVRQRGWRGALKIGVPALLIGAALVELAYLPFGGLTRLLEVARDRSWWPTGTWTAALFFKLRDGLHWPHPTAVAVVIGGATLLFGLAALLVMLKVRDLRAGMWGVVLAYLLIGSHWFQPWYAVWLVVFTAIIADRRLTAYTFVLTFFMLLHPIVDEYLSPQFGSAPGSYHAGMAALTLLGPQILALILIARTLRRPQRLSLVNSSI